MKLILTAPKGEDYKGKLLYNDYRMGEILYAYLYYKGIYIGEYHNFQRMDGYDLEWNPVCNFYDLRLLPILGDGKDVQKTHWDQVENWLKEEGYKYKRENSSWWKWIYPEGSTRILIRGVRFFIYPKNYGDSSESI